MRFLVLATDYDGTLAADGRVDEKTLQALLRLRDSGRKLVMVTGRHLPDLRSVFPELDLFDRVVVENGGLLYVPETRAEKLLCGPPDERLVATLRESKIPFALGRTIIATWRPHEGAVRAAIRDLGLDLQAILNKGSVMVLPSGVDKATGLQAALDEMGILPHSVVSVGDAENDLSFLQMSGCSVAVANALSSLKEQADVVLPTARGEGVAELIDQMLADDLAKFDTKLAT
jgi:HAD superfamily hydrolase (TIGR01484 family)